MIIGLDVGGTKTHGVCFDTELRPISEIRVPTAAGLDDDVADLVLRLIATLEAAVDDPIVGIGIGIPGLVDRQRGSVRQAVNLGIGADPLEIVARLTSVHDVPCHLDNDVNVAALGAFHTLQLDPAVSDLAYLSIGTGIAAGLILGGSPHRGSRGVAGEIGHFPFAPDGPACECGLRGCLEVMASGTAIGRLWPGSAGRSPTESLLQAAADGDRRAVDVLRSVSDHLARAIYLLAVTYDVAYVVIGGGVADVGEPLLVTIADGLKRLASQSEFAASLDLGDRIVLKPAGPIGALGAASLVTAPPST